MLDADIALYAIRRRPSVRACLRARSGSVFISALAYSQLLQGLSKSDETRLDIEGLLKVAPVIGYDERASNAYGVLVALLGFSRPLMLDRMIAAHAISVGVVLVTNNIRDFSGIPGVNIENWAEPNL